MINCNMRFRKQFIIRFKKRKLIAEKKWLTTRMG